MYVGHEGGEVGGVSEGFEDEVEEEKGLEDERKDVPGEGVGVDGGEGGGGGGTD